jgi:hypothetical protein
MPSVIVPQWASEWGILALIAIIVSIALMRPRRLLTTIAIVVCFAALAIRAFSTIAVARRLVGERQASGAWSREYSEGISDLESYAVATSKYILVTGLGLALLALRRYRSGPPREE